MVGCQYHTVAGTGIKPVQCGIGQHARLNPVADVASQPDVDSGWTMADPQHAGGIVTRLTARGLPELHNNIIPVNRLLQTAFNGHAAVNPGRQHTGFTAGDSADRKSTRLNSSHVRISYAV